MKKNLVFVLSALLISCFLPNIARAANTVTLASLDWEPYIGEKLKDQGYVDSLAREAFKASNYTVKISFMPWARVVAMTKEAKYDGYLPEYFAESLKTDFLVSEPFPGGPLGFFKRKTDAITFKTLEDLKAYKIGVVRDYVNTVEFDKATFLQKDVANNDITNLRKLVGKRLDLVVVDKFVGLYLLKQDMPDQAQEVEFMAPVLEEKSLYLCISKKTPDAEAKIKAFNDGLKIIKDNGTIDALLKANGF
ncbi:MAG: transporter substrate-binding domain-containing protein [Desulfoprunum sp.]|nr:transporter substrate-binding domain-containing protein [Desulfoprunum sp.]